MAAWYDDHEPSTIRRTTAAELACLRMNAGGVINFLASSTVLMGMARVVGAQRRGVRIGRAIMLIPKEVAPYTWTLIPQSAAFAALILFMWYPRGLMHL